MLHRQGERAKWTHSARLSRRATALGTVEAGLERIGLVGSDGGGGGEGNAGEEGDDGNGELHFD